MKYRSGYKYQLAENEVFETGITPTKTIRTKFITMQKDGTMWVKSGYAWDGPSGPTYDSKNSMRGSCCHDALYQLMRKKKIGKKWRSDADALLEAILEEDGMWNPRRWYWLRGVVWFAGGAIKPENEKKVYEAP